MPTAPITQYDIYAIFEMVRKQCPAIYPEFREKLDKTINELVAKRGRTRGLVTRMSNDASLLSSDAQALPEGVWLLNILDMGDKAAVADIATHAVVQVFWVLDFNDGTLVDKTSTLESVQ
jgi:spore germination protein GerM